MPHRQLPFWFFLKIGAVRIRKPAPDIIPYGNATEGFTRDRLLGAEPVIVYSAAVFTVFFGYKVCTGVVTGTAAFAAVFAK
jgi:hypothetical protein